jgi:hypothetical protein
MSQTSVGTGTDSDLNENPAPHGYPHKTLGAELHSSPDSALVPVPAAGKPAPVLQPDRVVGLPALSATSFSMLAAAAIPPLAPGEAVASSELLAPDELLASLSGQPDAFALEAFPDAPNAGPGPSALQAACGEGP